MRFCVTPLERKVEMLLGRVDANRHHNQRSSREDRYHLRLHTYFRFTAGTPVLLKLNYTRAGSNLMLGGVKSCIDTYRVASSGHLTGMRPIPDSQ